MSAVFDTPVPHLRLVWDRDQADECAVDPLTTTVPDDGIWSPDEPDQHDEHVEACTGFWLDRLDEAIADGNVRGARAAMDELGRLGCG